MTSSVPPKCQRFPAAKQRLLDSLLDKNSEGVITPDERATLEQLVGEAEQLMVSNARRLADFAQVQTGAPSPSAVPVTIWVQAQHAKP
jgi:hypothetical protein